MLTDSDMQIDMTMCSQKKIEYEQLLYVNEQGRLWSRR